MICTQNTKVIALTVFFLVIKKNHTEKNNYNQIFIKSNFHKPNIQ